MNQGPKNLEELFEQYKKEELEERVRLTRKVIHDAFKEIYKDKLDALIFKENPFLKLIKK